jgi:hypothetical protein
LAPWADALYAGDGKWWFLNAGLPEFEGAKFTCFREVRERYPALQFIECVNSGDDYEGCNRIITSRGYIGSGGNSGFQAINLAVQLGACRIVLVGFDMRVDNGVHWHGEHRTELGNPGLDNVIKWRRILDEAASELVGMGVEIINASASSALTSYPIMSLEKALNRDRDESAPVMVQRRARRARRTGTDLFGERVTG